MRLKRLESAPQQGSQKIVKYGDTSLHVFGLKCDHIDDTLVVGRGVNREIKKSITRRMVLKFISFIFDSIVFVAPYIARARLLLKKFWSILEHPLISRQRFLPGTLVLHL